MNRITLVQLPHLIIVNEAKHRLSRLFAVNLFWILLVFTSTGCIAQQRTLLAL
jgi:hypothetical protein